MLICVDPVACWINLVLNPMTTHIENLEILEVEVGWKWELRERATHVFLFFLAPSYKCSNIVEVEIGPIISPLISMIIMILSTALARCHLFHGSPGYPTCILVWFVWLRISSTVGWRNMVNLGGELQYPAWWTNILQWKITILMGKSPCLMGKSPFLMGKSPFLMGKSTISTAMFHCFLYVHQAGYENFTATAPWSLRGKHPKLWLNISGLWVIIYPLVI